MTTPYPFSGDDARVISGGEQELRRILKEQRGLSPSQMVLIADVMRGSGIGFEEAALRLGLITPEDIRRALGLSSGADASHDLDHPQDIVNEESFRSVRRAVTKAPLLGLPVKPTAGLAGLNDRFSSRSERMLALRTELLLTQAAAPGRACMIAVISAFPGEGRSRLAAELAISFAQLRDSTLLVDADMRRSSQHRLFEGANRSEGLAQAIAGSAQPIVQPVVGLPELSVLTAGAAPANPLDLLSDRLFEDLMASWRSQYRFVILDTPPVSECADGLAVAHSAGRALVVCRANQTTHEGARAMLRRLATTQAKVMGAVINHF